MHLFISADNCKPIAPRKFTYCLSKLVKRFDNARLPVHKEGDNVFWDWILQMFWSEESTRDSITKFAWIVKIRSRHDEESLKMYLGSLTNCYYPNWEVTPSILEPSCVIMSLLYQRLGFALKPPRRTVRKGLFTIAELRFNSKLLINDLKSSWDWLDERYNLMKLPSLPLIFILKFMHSVCK